MRFKSYFNNNFSRCIRSVMNTRFKSDDTMTIGEAIDKHKGLKDVRWYKDKDSQGRIYVVVTAYIEDINKFFTPTLFKFQNGLSSDSMITRSLFELIRYRKYMTLFYNYDDIFSYLHHSRIEDRTDNMLEFDHKKSSIMIYIKFLRVARKEFISISSGYSAKLKVSNPELGYFGGLFDDLDLGKKCIDRIYSGKPITLESAF